MPHWPLESSVIYVGMWFNVMMVVLIFSACVHSVGQWIPLLVTASCAYNPPKCFPLDRWVTAFCEWLLGWGHILHPLAWRWPNCSPAFAPSDLSTSAWRWRPSQTCWSWVCSCSHRCRGMMWTGGRMRRLNQSLDTLEGLKTSDFKAWGTFFQRRFKCSGSRTSQHLSSIDPGTYTSLINIWWPKMTKACLSDTNKDRCIN